MRNLWKNFRGLFTFLFFVVFFFVPNDIEGLFVEESILNNEIEQKERAKNEAEKNKHLSKPLKKLAEKELLAEKKDARNVFKRIKEEKKLVAITDYNSTNYFIYRGAAMGFQYELLKRFAKHIGVKLEIKVSKNLNNNFDAIENGTCDLIALNLAITKERTQKLKFAEPYLFSKQVLIQRKPDNLRKLSKRQIEKKMLRNQILLAQKEIHVQKGTAYFNRLKNLSEEIGDTIFINESNFECEELIAKVAKGEIDYTVCDENIAKLNQTYYPNLDVKTAISFPQKIAWAVRKEKSNEFVEKLNTWIKEFKKTKDFRYIYARYFENPKAASFVKNQFHSLKGNKISKYDKLIKKYSKEIDWDWKTLAALIYTESNFNHKAKSWEGAFGLMQLMPSTAAIYDIDSMATPEQHIAAGVKYIQWLDKIFEKEITDKNERMKFILAAYNVGIGHVFDARQLAKKYNKHSHIWDDNVAYFILHKSNPKYYKDAVVKYGYCRGIEPYSYVNQVIELSNHYKNILKN